MIILLAQKPIMAFSLHLPNAHAFPTFEKRIEISCYFFFTDQKRNEKFMMNSVFLKRSLEKAFPTLVNFSIASKFFFSISIVYIFSAELNAPETYRRVRRKILTGIREKFSKPPNRWLKENTISH